MTVRQRMLELIEQGKPFYTFEFFVPITESGKQNLLLRIDRMAGMAPLFVDITYHPKTVAQTLDLASKVNKYSGVNAVMHLTCTDFNRDQLKATLRKAREEGLMNILALRGDPYDPSKPWQKPVDGLASAEELVKLIREEHGDYFGIAVAGYPESHMGAGCGSTEYHTDIKFLKRKVEAGADWVMTQLFFEPSFYKQYVTDCRAAGIHVPIIPGIMPIQNVKDFTKVTSYIKCTVPDHVTQDLEPIKDDDAAVKKYGVKYALSMCERLIKDGAPGCHFYTLNLERSVRTVIDSLDHILDPNHVLPWRPSGEAKREAEDVRPIFWANRPWSYLDRTAAWDDFPNGRWGDSASPAFGGLPEIHFSNKITGSDMERKAEWGESPVSEDEIHEVFAQYIEEKVSCLPWCEKGLHLETGTMRDRLARINRQGFMTINSQPKVNGAESSDKNFGWGPPDGYVYQKAYIEFFCSPAHLDALEEAIQENKTAFKSLVYNAVNARGDIRASESASSLIPNTTNSNSNTVAAAAASSPSNASGSHLTFKRSVCAVTWGVFPGREILQPTVVDTESFLVWKEEAFDLWISSWASIYSEESEAYEILYDIHDSVFLVNVVDNDYIKGDIFKVFDRALEIMASKQE